MKLKHQFPLLRPLLWRAEQFFLFCLVATLGRAGPRFRKRLAGLIGPALCRFFPFRRELIERQLADSFPEWTDSDKRAILPSIYTHLVAFGLETIALSHVSSDRLIESLEGIEPDVANVRRWVDKGNGVILLTAHMGNWEWIGAYLSAVGIDVVAVAKPMHNPYSEAFIQKTRRRHGLKIVSINENQRQIVSHLRKGGVVGLVADQDARKAGIFVDFFGRPASTFTGPARLAYRLGVPILPYWGYRNADGSLRYVADDPILADPDAPEEQEIRRITQAHVTALEKAVRADPAQYFWIHRRWKTKAKHRAGSSKNL